MAKQVLTHDLSEPLGNATSARVEVHAGTGNLTIDRLGTGERVLASGTLQYLENTVVPTSSLDASNGQASLTVRSTSTARRGFRFPWQACNGETDWQIHLNPAVSADIDARSGGGNLKLDLAGLLVTHAAADTGGGNIDLVLPDGSASLRATARTGAGNVTVELGRDMKGSSTLTAHSGAGNVDVRVPAGLAALIHATSGMGKIIVDPCFSQVDKNTYQSPDYDSAANKVELTLTSGAGNVVVSAG